MCVAGNGGGGAQGLRAHIAEDVSMQGGAMHPGALCVPQADGVVRGTGDKGTGGQAGLVTVLHFRVDLTRQRGQSHVSSEGAVPFLFKEKGMRLKGKCWPRLSPVSVTQ